MCNKTARSHRLGHSATANPGAATGAESEPELTAMDTSSSCFISSSISPASLRRSSGERAFDAGAESTALVDQKCENQQHEQRAPGSDRRLRRNIERLLVDKRGQEAAALARRLLSVACRADRQHWCAQPRGLAHADSRRARRTTRRDWPEHRRRRKQAGALQLLPLVVLLVVGLALLIGDGVAMLVQPRQASFGAARRNALQAAPEALDRQLSWRARGISWGVGHGRVLGSAFLQIHLPVCRKQL